MLLATRLRRHGDDAATGEGRLVGGDLGPEDALAAPGRREAAVGIEAARQKRRQGAIAALGLRRVVAQIGPRELQGEVVRGRVNRRGSSARPHRLRRRDQIAKPDQAEDQHNAHQREARQPRAPAGPPRVEPLAGERGADAKLSFGVRCLHQPSKPKLSLPPEPPPWEGGDGAAATGIEGAAATGLRVDEASDRGVRPSRPRVGRGRESLFRSVRVAGRTRGVGRTSAGVWCNATGGWAASLPDPPRSLAAPITPMATAAVRAATVLPPRSDKLGVGPKDLALSDPGSPMVSSRFLEPPDGACRPPASDLRP